MEERGTREWDCLAEERLGGRGMRTLSGVRKDEGGGDGYTEGQVAMDDGKGVGLLGG